MRIGGDRRTPFAHRFAIARKSARRSADFANRARLRAECRLAQGASADRCEYAERVKDSVLKSSRAALDRGLFIGLSIELLRCKTTDAGGCGPVDFPDHSIGNSLIFDLAIFGARRSPRKRDRQIASSQRQKNLSAMPKDIFERPRARSRNAIGISRTRSWSWPCTIASKTILKPLVGGASSTNRERAMPKQPPIESRTPVSG